MINFEGGSSDYVLK